MLKTALWIYAVCVQSSFARPQIQQQQQQNIQPENELPEIQKKDIQISKFHVNTSIQMRYGIQGRQWRQRRQRINVGIGDRCQEKTPSYILTLEI